MKQYHGVAMQNLVYSWHASTSAGLPENMSSYFEDGLVAAFLCAYEAFTGPEDQPHRLCGSVTSMEIFFDVVLSGAISRSRELFQAASVWLR